MKNTTPYLERVERRHKILAMRLSGYRMDEIAFIFGISTKRVVEILTRNNLCGNRCPVCMGKEIRGMGK